MKKPKIERDSELLERPASSSRGWGADDDDNDIPQLLALGLLVATRNISSAVILIIFSPELFIKLIVRSRNFFLI
jgi:hypothetical protein